jgi:site-specific DNA-adenine methylase
MSRVIQSSLGEREGPLSYTVEENVDGTYRYAYALPAPFPWFGGKRKVGREVWARFGRVLNYVEPFFGSGAVLFGRPEVGGIETVNDLDGFVANFWRAVKLRPDETAEAADSPVNENDLHGRHAWLVGQREELRARLEGDPEWCDPKIAGWWVWGVCSWIGSGFCSGRGPWSVVGGQLVHLGDAGRGVNRKRVHLGDAGRGVNRKRVHLGNAGQGRLSPWFSALCERLSTVRVCSGDWSRICGPSVTHKHGLTGVFLDPPYADTANRTKDLYSHDSTSVAHSVREWAIEAGEHPLMRIALCGYDGEHEMPASWSTYEWNAGEGFGAQAEERSENGKKERVWFSPACLSPAQGRLFAEVAP